MISGGLDDIRLPRATSMRKLERERRDGVCNGSRAHRGVSTCYHNSCWLHGVPGNWRPHPHLSEDCPRIWCAHPGYHRIHVHFHVSSSLSARFDIVLVLTMSQQEAWLPRILWRNELLDPFSKSTSGTPRKGPVRNVSENSGSRLFFRARGLSGVHSRPADFSDPSINNTDSRRSSIQVTQSPLQFKVNEIPNVIPTIATFKRKGDFAGSAAHLCSDLRAVPRLRTMNELSWSATEIRNGSTLSREVRIRVMVLTIG